MATMSPKTSHSLPSPSHLFTVRLWLEELGPGQTEWRGQVQHVLSGESGYFRNPAGLVEFLSTMLTKLAGDEGAARPG